ncbi:phosphatidylserine decarboxylase family protein [Lewinella sp. LCG006]|uniref:phosphatidylserine decarboxylase family protein n=1 Tax=Lewinella sp. LCG006 TaxID=3231911 RepID=UPI00345F65DA
MIHKEGRKILPLAFITLLGLALFGHFYLAALPGLLLKIACGVFFLLILQFFRNPKRVIPLEHPNLVYVPADGKVVVIEKVQEEEYFQEERLQVSIFMSPLNVHVNRSPFPGIVKYFKYHPGKYLVAWHPKSSTENERSTVVIDNGKHEILLRQIAGAVARRIRTYVSPNQQLQQGEEFGFITFGSRVDVFLPLDAEMKVSIGDEVKGNIDVLAELS